jgi:glycerol-3-phosphate dehydrogenase
MANSAPLSLTDRAALLQQMRQGQALEWDLIIVGGGICGAGVLREAVREGYRALLVEQRDFSWGASSRSSKMVHGGLRYLGMGDIKLTRESVTERERLLQEAPGLVERTPFYFSVRKGHFPGRWPLSLVLWFYDRIAGLRDHRYCPRSELLEHFPGLNKEVTGAGLYTDAITDDSRLVLRILAEGVRAGGSALNYVQAQKLLRDEHGVCGLVVEAAPSGERLELRAPVVVNATGAWADRLRNQLNPEKRIRPLRGSHLVIPAGRFPVPDVLSFFHPTDRRPVFAYEWDGATVLGTTDLDHRVDLDVEASISEEEVDYLLDAAHFLFPDRPLSCSDVVSTWAGVRPVIGSEKSKDPSKERRDHAVWSDEGLVSISGGKLTTFRVMALDAINAARGRLRPPRESGDDRVFLPLDSLPEQVAAGSAHRGRRLLGRYGDAAASMLAEAPEEERELLANTPYCLAECRWAARYEAVQHLDDLLLRRTRLGMLLESGAAELFPSMRKICSEELHWDEARWARELERYSGIISAHYGLPDGSASRDGAP